MPFKSIDRAEFQRKVGSREESERTPSLRLAIRPLKLQQCASARLSIWSEAASPSVRLNYVVVALTVNFIEIPVLDDQLCLSMWGNGEDI